MGIKDKNNFNLQMDIHEENGKKGLMGGKKNAYNENPEAFTVYSQQRNAGVKDAIVSN